ncbi:unnamed protein product [Ambrosiozyma monospora]|uniref:Unnamed protein product n=1 Tax=Ambrosiozyma monospora TaxID=43982 RepID=A0ACB5TDA3_AMBMO|nr:unnamed protein product [Ambrosiozyma monospora]
MYDFCACYHFGDIFAGMSRDRYEWVCPETGALNGFTDDRILKPGMKYKKRFMFRLPPDSIETTCKHRLPNHLSLPSSYGVDLECFKGAAANIRLNPRTGFGVLNRDGSPIKTKDYSLYGQAVSYAITVKLIGRSTDFQNQCKKLNKNGSYHFVLLKDDQYILRVVGNSPAFDQSSFLTTKQQMSQLYDFLDNTIDELKCRSGLIESGITDRNVQDEIMEGNGEHKKAKQLVFQQTRPQADEILQIKTIENEASVRFTRSLFNRIEGELTIHASTNKDISMNRVFPKEIEYLNRPGSKPPSTPSSSAASIINTKPLSDSITIKLHYIPSTKDNGVPRLPSTIAINPILHLINIQSEFPLPVTIDNECIKESSSSESLQSKLSQMRKNTVSKLFEIKDLSIANKLPYTSSLNDDISKRLIGKLMRMVTTILLLNLI